MEQKVQPSRPWLGAVIALAITAALLAVLMLWRPSTLYLWLKALHVIAVIAWMAGMLYLPRLFVYHCEAEPGSKQSETFKVMERRLLTRHHQSGDGRDLGARAVARLGRGAVYAAGWLHAKFALVLAMSAVHGMFVRYVRDFAEDRNRHSQRFYRIINEVPTLLMIGIVILVVVKPF